MRRSRIRENQMIKQIETDALRNHGTKNQLRMNTIDSELL